jgi:hypothetical protein
VSRVRAVLGSLTVLEAAVVVVLAGLAATGVLAGPTEPVLRGPCGVDECAQVAIVHQQRWALISRIRLVAAWCVAFFIQVLTMPAWLQGS